MLPEIPADEFADALDACVGGVLWETGVEQPPVDALVVAGRLGMVVAQDRNLPGRARFARLADERGSECGQATIVVGPAERPEREQWAVAHEIGECVAYRVFDTLAVRPELAPPHARELVANHLAGCLLLPRPWFAVDGSALDWELFKLKRRYSTASHELIARRMLEMRPPIVITVCDLGRVAWRRSNASGRPPRMLPEDLTVWRESHATGLPCRAMLDSSATGLESVRCWPIHEPDWKREILRSEIAEW
ncbi:MAG: ImmA/IrrE family metallo-endopeptidase [Pirellulales bacterium]